MRSYKWQERQRGRSTKWNLEMYESTDSGGHCCTRWIPVRASDRAKYEAELSRQGIVPLAT